MNRVDNVQGPEVPGAPTKMNALVLEALTVPCPWAPQTNGFILVGGQWILGAPTKMNPLVLEVITVPCPWTPKPMGSFWLETPGPLDARGPNPNEPIGLWTLTVPCPWAPEGLGTPVGTYISGRKSTHGAASRWIDIKLFNPFSYFSFQPVLHNWCIKGHV